MTRLISAALSTLALVACNSALLAPPPVIPLAQPDSPARATCRLEHCADAPDDDACMALSCVRVAPVIAANMSAIRLDDGALFVELHPSVTPGNVGGVTEVYRDPIFVGVTAITPDGEELDLLVQTRLPDAPDQPIVFTADLDQDVDQLLVGLWSTKIEPCDVDRSGCKAFGFVLDGSLATWPPNVYDTGARQRLWKTPPTLRVVAPADSTRGAAVAAVRGPLDAIAQIFGTELTVTEAPGVSRAVTEIRYRTAGDAFAANELAAAITKPNGLMPTVRRLSDPIDVDFEVIVGADILAP